MYNILVQLATLSNLTIGVHWTQLFGPILLWFHPLLTGFSLLVISRFATEGKIILDFIHFLQLKAEETESFPPFVEDVLQQRVHPLNMDVTLLQHPGIYEILDTENDKLYYGETDCLTDRMTRHYRDLKKGTHHSSGLQKAYNGLKDKGSFQFIVLHAGPEWSNRRDREEVEGFYALENSYRCYNVLEFTNKRTIKPIQYGTKRYASARQAAKGESISRTEILRRCANPSLPTIYFLSAEEVSYGSILLFGKKGNGPSVLFEHYGECIEAGYATNVQNARRKIQRGDDGWRYADVDVNGKPIRTAYTLKPGEQSYKMLMESQQQNQKNNSHL